MSAPPKAVDVVMLTWNKAELTRRAIESYRRYVRHPIRLICVDNGSTDDTLQYLRSAADLLISNSDNVGAIRGRNEGWVATTAPYVLFSDNDIEFECDIVAPLVAAMDREPRLGIAGPLLNEHLIKQGTYPEGASLSQITAAVVETQPQGLSETEFVQACAMMVRRAMVEEIGAFDTVFDPYAYEEFDLANRAVARGWRLGIVLDCYAHHHGSGARALPEREAIVEQSRQAFLRRWTISVGDGQKGVVRPFPTPGDPRSAPEPGHLGDHVKLVERTVARCRLPADWPEATERFVADLPVIGQEALVVGCGAGEAVKQLRHRYWRQAVGLSPVLGEDAGYGVRQGFGFAMPFGDASFDAVIARHSLEHSPMPLIDLLEIRRVLRPKGLAVLAVPDGRGPAPASPTVLAPLTDAQWQRLVAQAGLALDDTRRMADGQHVVYVAGCEAA
jgi:GT2 family glycosyltransferase